MTDNIRILITDDHAVVREGLRALIDTEPGMELVGEATDGIEAVQMARSLQPDVILLDLVMPRADGIAAIEQIMREDPAARILVLTSFAEEEKVFSAIKAGALGYLLKNASPQRLLGAIRDVYQGEPSISPTIAIKMMRELGYRSKSTGIRLGKPPHMQFSGGRYPDVGHNCLGTSKYKFK